MTILSWLFGREPPERRVGTIAVTADVLLAVFQMDGTKAFRFEGVPKDARVETMWVDPASQILSIAISSEELPLVTEGVMATPISVTVYVTEPTLVGVEC